MYRCKFPRWFVKLKKFFDSFYAYEKKVSEFITTSRFYAFLKRWGKWIVGIQFAFLLISRNNAINKKELVEFERDAFKRSNELLINERIFRNSSFKSNEIYRWKKIMLTSVKGDTIFRMVDVSANYEKKFLKYFGLTMSDYIGFTDYDVWGDEIGDEFYFEDLHVARTGMPVFATGTDPTGGQLLILKEKHVEGGRTYVIGAAIEKERAIEWFKE